MTEQAIIQWLNLLKQDQLIPESIDIQNSIIDAIQIDDISSVICYLIFDLQDEIPQQKRLNYIQSQLDLPITTLQELQDNQSLIQIFVQKLASKIAEISKESNVLPQFKFQNEEENIQFDDFDQDLKQESDKYFQINIEDSPKRIKSEESLPIPLEASTAIQQELIFEIQSLNNENQRLVQKSQNFDEIEKIFLEKYQLQIVQNDILQRELIENLLNQPLSSGEFGARINECEIEITIPQINNQNVLDLIQQQIDAELETSPFSVEILKQETPNSIQHFKQVTNVESQQLKQTIVDLQNEILLLKNNSSMPIRQVESPKSRSSSNIRKKPQLRDNDVSDMFNFNMNEIEENDELLTNSYAQFIYSDLKELLIRLSQDDTQFRVILSQNITEATAIQQVEFLVNQTRQIARNELNNADNLIAELQSQIQLNQLQNKQKTSQIKQTGQLYNSDIIQYEKLEKCRSVIQQNIKDKLLLESEVKDLKCQLDGWQRRCRALQINYESERLASKRVVNVDKFGLERLRAELADTRRIAEFKGLRK